jgi:hypothetical protein
MSRIIFSYHVYAGHSAPFGPRMGTGTPTPARGPPSTFLSTDGGRSRIYNSGTSQGARRQCFLELMVDASGSTAPAPHKGAAINVS